MAFNKDLKQMVEVDTNNRIVVSDLGEKYTGIGISRSTDNNNLLYKKYPIDELDSNLVWEYKAVVTAGGDGHCGVTIQDHNGGWYATLTTRGFNSASYAWSGQSRFSWIEKRLGGLVGGSIFSGPAYAGIQGVPYWITCNFDTDTGLAYRYVFSDRDRTNLLHTSSIAYMYEPTTLDYFIVGSVAYSAAAHWLDVEFSEVELTNGSRDIMLLQPCLDITAIDNVNSAGDVLFETDKITYVNHEAYNSEGHSHIDMGIDYFDGDFHIDFEFRWDEASIIYRNSGIAFLTNTVQNQLDLYNNNIEHITLNAWGDTATTQRFQFATRTTGTWLTSIYYFTEDITYYISFRRDMSASTYGRVYVEFYTDFDRTTLEHSMFLDMLDLQAYRYFMPFASLGVLGTTGRQTNGYSRAYNLDAANVDNIIRINDYNSTSESMYFTREGVIRDPVATADAFYHYFDYGADTVKFFDVTFSDEFSDSSVGDGGTWWHLPFNVSDVGYRPLYLEGDGYFNVQLYTTTTGQQRYYYYMKYNGGQYSGSLANVVTNTRYYFHSFREKGATPLLDLIWVYQYSDPEMTIQIGIYAHYLHSTEAYKDYRYVSFANERRSGTANVGFKSGDYIFTANVITTTVLNFGRGLMRAISRFFR